jgi:hypothetical protein
VLVGESMKAGAGRESAVRKVGGSEGGRERWLITVETDQGTEKQEVWRRVYGIQGTTAAHLKYTALDPMQTTLSHPG